MKRLPFMLGLCLLAGACAQMHPASREEIVENLDPIVKIERRGTQLLHVMEVLRLALYLDDAEADKLKEHYNVFYIYRRAATFSLVQGNFAAYNEQLEVASKELDSIEDGIKDIVKNASLR